NLHVIQSFLGHAADLKDIVRDAIGIGAVDHRAAGRHAAVIDNVERAGDAVDRELVAVDPRQANLGVLHRDVVVPALGNDAANPDDAAERVQVQVVLTSAAFDVAPTDVQGGRGVRRDVRRRTA